MTAFPVGKLNPQAAVARSNFGTAPELVLIESRYKVVGGNPMIIERLRISGIAQVLLE